MFECIYRGMLDSSSHKNSVRVQGFSGFYEHHFNSQGITLKYWRHTYKFVQLCKLG